MNPEPEEWESVRIVSLWAPPLLIFRYPLYYTLFGTSLPRPNDATYIQYNLRNTHSSMRIRIVVCEPPRPTYAYNLLITTEICRYHKRPYLEPRVPTWLSSTYIAHQLVARV